MIISASYRTDIPAYYGDWLMNRLAAGYALVASPYGGPDYRVSLRRPKAQALQLWTRNIGPLLPRLDAVQAALPFAVTFTLTGYPRALEKATLPAERAVAQLRDLANRFGRRVAVWRYDPVVISDLTPPDWHRAQVARIARELRGVVDEATFSFLQPYAKSARHLDAAARQHGFAWRDPPDDEKKALLAELATIARQEGMTPTLCAQPHLLSPAIEAAHCIDARRLSDIAGAEIASKEKGNRPGCACALSRDIGAYDTCAQGCAYCYAVRAPDLAQRNLAAHDPQSERLVAARLRQSA